MAFRRVIGCYLEHLPWIIHKLAIPIRHRFIWGSIAIHDAKKHPIEPTMADSKKQAYPSRLHHKEHLAGSPKQNNLPPTINKLPIKSTRQRIKLTSFTKKLDRS